MTHTVATVEISAAAYSEIERLLLRAGYDHRLVGGGIDMQGLAITRGAAPEQPTVGAKLATQIADLVSLAHRFNRDGQPGTATKAQIAINAITDLLREDEGWFGGLPWDWEPAGFE